MRRVILASILILISLNLCAQKNKRKRLEKLDSSSAKNIVIFGEEDSLGFIRVYNKDIRKWGFIDRDSNILIPFTYDQLDLFDEKGMSIARKEKKFGAINRKNRISIPFDYSDLGTFIEYRTYAKKGNRYGYITRRDKEVVPFVYEEAGNFYGCKLAKIALDGEYGFINSKGREIVPPDYSLVGQSYSPKDSFVLLEEDGRWAFCSCKGEKLSFFEFEEPEKTYNKTDGFGYSVNGLILLNQYNQSAYAMVDDSLHIVVPFGLYPYAKPFNQYRWAIVGRIGKYGAIDEFGNIKIPLEYDSIYEAKINPHEEGFKNLIVSKNDLFGLLDTNGNMVTEVIYKSISMDYSYGDSKVEEFFHLRNLQNREGFVDSKGNIQVPFQYQWIDNFLGREVAFALKNDKYGLIDAWNNQKTDFKYDEFLGYYNNLCPVRIDSNYGIIDKDGHELIPVEYKHLEPCLYNYRKVIAVKDGETGIINSQNEIVIPFEYDSISNWELEGHREHIVRKNNRYGIIDTLGNIVIPAIYDELKFYSKSSICVAQNGKYGMINRKNEIQIPLKYDAIFVDNYWWSYKDDYICVKEGNRFYEISKDGKLGKEISEKDIKKAFWYYLNN